MGVQSGASCSLPPLKIDDYRLQSAPRPDYGYKFTDSSKLSLSVTAPSYKLLPVPETTLDRAALPARGACDKPFR